MIVLGAGVARVAGAQAIEGTVRDAVSGDPIAGAIVTAIGRGDGILASVVTNEHGHFRVVVPRSSATRLKALHIGHEPATVPLPQADTIVITMTPVVWAVTAMKIVGQEACAESNDAPQANALWSQVQAALLAGIVSRQTTPAKMEAIEYARAVDLTRRPTLLDSQQTHVIRELGSNPFTTGQPPRFLAERGYVIAKAGGYDIYPLGDEVLADSTFATTHCFHMARTARSKAEVGISFEPTLDRADKSDILGTIWVDTTNLSLTRVDYQYTDFHIPGVDGSGTAGSLTFARAPNGTPLLVSWWLRRPPTKVEVQWPDHSSTEIGSRRIGLTVTLTAETGGELVHAIWPDGTEWQTTLPSVRVTVLDEATGRERPGVAVRLINADMLGFTDSAGRFEFRNVLPGPYLFAVEDTILAAFSSMLPVAKPQMDIHGSGKIVGENWVKLTNGRFNNQPLVRPLVVDSLGGGTVVVRLPDSDAAVARQCARGGRTPATGLAVWLPPVAGRQETVQGQRVTVRWTDGSRPFELVSTLDNLGRAIVCGVPRAQQVTVFIASDSLHARAVRTSATRPVTIVALVGR